MDATQIIAGRFEIANLEKDMLGQGGMGKVFRGVDHQTDQVVAIKVLRPEFVTEYPEMVARFVREGEALRQLDHPNIVKMVASVEEAGQHYLVMEYIAGGSLRSMISSASTSRTAPEDVPAGLPIPRVLEISLDLADALTRAHRLDIIHRDLKPENVLLAEDGTPHLTDFGVARVGSLPSSTQPGMLVGTIDYLSPEACLGDPLDRRTDIWAFGIMLYEMLMGKRPFAGGSLTAVLTAILTQPVPAIKTRPLPHQNSLQPDSFHPSDDLYLPMPDALADLIYRMLEKDPQLRIPSVRMVGAELEAISDELRLPGMYSTPIPKFTPDRFAMSGATGDGEVTPHQAEVRKHNLPTQPTPFIGREAELAEVARLLSTSHRSDGSPDPVRLLTILGPGGMGKTRLALAAASAQLDAFPHGVYFVSLAALQSAQAIVPAVAEAMSFSFYVNARGLLETNPRQQLLDYLRQKRLLLVMDNFEHMLEGADLVTDILSAAPEVKILATSRIRLNTQGEQVFYLSGMEFPDWETPQDALEYSAVKLFMQSARRVQPAFELQADNLRYIARISRLVQGMPLAILLAAAWVDVLSLEEIASEIERSLDFLQTEMRDVPERQRSIRSVFEYSWNMLTQPEQEVFQALSVFRGGFTRQAAQEVTRASLRELMSLVNKSLLHRTPAGRYEIHELLRQYAADRLDQNPAISEAVHDLHCMYYTQALERWQGNLKAGRQRLALEEMNREIENARAAWTWAVKHLQIERLGRSLEALYMFYLQRIRYLEGEAVCREAVEALETVVSQPLQPVISEVAGASTLEAAWLLARIRNRQGYFVWWLGPSEPAQYLFNQSWGLLDEIEALNRDMPGIDTRPERGFILWRRAWEGYREDTRQFYEQSLAIFREVGDRWWTALILSDYGQANHDVGFYPKAREILKECLEIRRSLGDQLGVADSVGRLCRTAWVQGSLEEAETLASEGLTIAREIGDPAALVQGLRDLGETSMRIGKFRDGLQLLEECQSVASDLGHELNFLLIDMFLCEAQAHLGLYEQGLAHAQNACNHFTDYEFSWGIGFSHYGLGLALLGQGKYGQAQAILETALPFFRNISQQDNLGWVLALLGYASLAQDKAGTVRPSEQAKAYILEALQVGSEIGAFFPLLYAMPAAALLLAVKGQPERAVEIYTLASRYRFVSASRWFAEVAGKQIEAIAASLPPEAVKAAQERGQALNIQETARQLAAELSHS
jgi:serine/threonine protein kinase/predicted ATPase